MHRFYSNTTRNSLIVQALTRGNLRERPAFFVIHRALHWKPLYRSVHIWHHRSVITTPFSAYSFHPVESFLLGSVMPLALVLHTFSPWALLGLTLKSLWLNVGGYLPHEQIRE